MAKNEIESIIKRFAIELKKEGIEIIKVFLYGSYARGSYREDSDIDVAVICKDFASDPIEQNMKLMRIAVHIDTRLSPISLSMTDFKNEYIPLVPEIKRGLDLTAITI